MVYFGAQGKCRGLAKRHLTKHKVQKGNAGIVGKNMLGQLEHLGFVRSGSIKQNQEAMTQLNELPHGITP